jgi:membrane associated rhomboid family serine protease
MLEDREYMRASGRRPSFEWRWSLTTIILVVNVVVFVTQSVAGLFLKPRAIENLFALSIGGLQSGLLWQPITFQFLHAGVWHLLANLMVIYFFGPPVEQIMGRRRFLSIYFGSGMFGGLLQLAAALVLPSHFGAAGVVGASAGAFGLVASFALLHPEQPLTLLLFFIIPFSMRAKFLLLFEVLLTVYGIIVPFGNIAHVAHLGGLMVGLAVTRWGGAPMWPSLHRSRRSILRPRELAGVHRVLRQWPAASPAPAELPPGEFISKEVDPILDKISAHGINSLTPRERRILEAASAKIDRR